VRGAYDAAVQARPNPAGKASTRLAIVAAVGLVTWFVASLFTTPLLAALIGWDTGALVFVAWIWLATFRLDAAATCRAATTQDDSRVAADTVLVLASVVSLFGVALSLLQASESAGFRRAAIIGMAVGTVAVSWLAVQAVFVLRYAHLYYRESGGMAFHSTGDPSYADFAYVAFTVGMTFQVSDTDITSPHIRRTVLRHALLSYIFGIAVIALTINVVAGLLRP
jgi:uncharacterized membrane protein